MKKNFISFLQEVKANYSNLDAATIIMGNEAADLDSMASAVSYAWYLHLDNPVINAVPFINIPRADFKLRTEAVFLFEEAGISSDLLLFTEDVDLNKLNESGNLNLILVDHNKIASGQAGLIDTVTEILDHHADEKSYPSGIPADIRPVGSAATIVAERFLKNQQDAVSEPLGTLLLGTILLDTVNLDPEAGRVTPDDTKAAEAIISITSLDKEKLFEKLQFEKFNVSSLGSYDLLRKDYKEWQLGSVKCGIGSVLQSVEAWIKKDPALVEACDRYLKERGLDVLLAMNAFTAPGFTRQIVVYIPDEQLRSQTISFLEASDLGLTAIETGDQVDKSCSAFYDQKNLGISRKKLQPILKDFFGN
jgi:exopolyphosphatase